MNAVEGSVEGTAFTHCYDLDLATRQPTLLRLRNLHRCRQSLESANRQVVVFLMMFLLREVSSHRQHSFPLVSNRSACSDDQQTYTL